MSDRFSDKLYEERISALFLRHQSVQSVGFGANSYKPGLDAMLRFDSFLESPSRGLRCIHVAGTNGKGSVCSMLAAALAGEGLKVGLYTSPHLIDFRERIKTVTSGGASLVSREYVWDFLERYSSGLEGLSFFEITTGMAFRYFADSAVDVAVIETGLGGRLDSTNIVTPLVSVITSIGLDHCAILGDTRAAIAWEKAGIFKPGVPAVVGERDAETSPVFDARAVEVGCPLAYADEFVTVPLPALDLHGPCRDVNFRTVGAALSAIGHPWTEASLDAVSKTAAMTDFRGRWECLRRPVGPDGRRRAEVICDIAHNPPALKLNFDKLAASHRPLVIVYGVMADKDLDGIAPLMPSGAEYVLVSPDSPRSMKVEELRSRLVSLRPDLHFTPAGSVASGVGIALSLAAPDPETLVYIGGSTFVVSEAAPLFFVS